MIRGHDRRRCCRNFSLEWLEGRTLLNAAHPSATAAEVRRVDATGPLHIKFTGSNRYSSTISIPTSNPLEPVEALVYVIDAQGRAARLGRVHLQASYDTASNSAAGFHAFSIFNGTGTLTDAHGDQLSVTFSGTSQPRGKNVLSTLNGAVSGGTGSFAGATGTLSATGRELPHGRIQLNVTVNS